MSLFKGRELIPGHMHAGVINYLDHRIAPGSFLRAVLENRLVHAFGRADDINLEAMPRWAAWLYNHCPASAWGSPEKVAAWLKEYNE